MNPGTRGVAMAALAATCLTSRSHASPTLQGVSASEYSQRRAALRASAPRSLLLLTARVPEGAGDLFRFRADSNLIYLTGVEAPGAWLALLPPGDPSGVSEMLFLPPTEREAGAWSDVWPGPDAGTRAWSGIAAVESCERLWSALAPSIRAAARVCALGAATQEPNLELKARVHAINPSATFGGDAEALVALLRALKSPEELVNLKRAADITAGGLRSAAHAIAPGRTEVAVEGTVIAAFRQAGALRDAFPCVVGAGPNSVILHHFSAARTMQAGELAVVDVGAEWDYYAGDLTRTFPVSGKFTHRQRELYNAVLETQRSCEAFIVPGKTTMRQVDRHARECLRASGLRAMDASGEQVTLDRFFPHLVGHAIGLDIHEGLPADGVLRKGVVFTLEPGVYIPSEGTGIRIEDDYAITEAGLEKLSASLPSDPARVEELMASQR